MGVEFSYVAQLPDKKKKMGSVAQKRRQEIRPANLGRFSPQEQQLMDRVLGRVKLPNVAWDQLIEDFKKKESKNVICNRYGIKPADLKWIKRYLGY